MSLLFSAFFVDDNKHACVLDQQRLDQNAVHSAHGHVCRLHLLLLGYTCICRDCACAL